MQPYVSRLSNIVFPIAVKFKLISPWHDIESGLANTPGNARAEAERRRSVGSLYSAHCYAQLKDSLCAFRAMALHALDQRLASSTSKAGSSAPRRSSSVGVLPAREDAPNPSAQDDAGPSGGEVVFDADKDTDERPPPKSASPQRSATAGPLSVPDSTGV